MSNCIGILKKMYDSKEGGQKEEPVNIFFQIQISVSQETHRKFLNIIQNVRISLIMYTSI